MIQISEYLDVRNRALQLQCNIPTELALLPRNFDIAKSKSELIHESSVPTIRTLWRRAGITETKIEQPEQKIPYTEEEAFEWIGPIVFVSAALLSQNPNAVAIALNVISNYLTDWFKGIPGSKKVRLDIVVEKNKGKTHIYKRIHYEGAPEGINTLAKIVHEVDCDE